MPPTHLCRVLRWRPCTSAVQQQTCAAQSLLRPLLSNITHHRRSPYAQPPTFQSFSTTSALQKKSRGAPKRDTRITMIRYFLYHPKNPRPLRFSRNRALRHWTIHRAWQLFRAKQRRKRETDLMRQYQCMKEACEALRLTGEDGLAVTAGVKANQLPEGVKDLKSVRIELPSEAQGEASEKRFADVDVVAAAERQRDVGRLYRVAMNKRGIYGGVPIEYARAQVETPSKAGWDHGWTR